MNLAEVWDDTKRILNDIAFYSNINTELNEFECARIRLERSGVNATIFSGSLSIAGQMEIVKEGEYKFISPNYIALVTERDNLYYISKMYGRQSDYQI